MIIPRFRIKTIIKSCVYPLLDTYMQKTKKTYTDTRARRNLSLVSSELQDVQRIMVSNIDDVLQRGVALSGKLSNCLQTWENTLLIFCL